MTLTDDQACSLIVAHRAFQTIFTRISHSTLTPSLTQIVEKYYQNSLIERTINGRKVDLERERIEF